MEEVILVDESGRETGTVEKLKAHREGLLHRAFSIFLVAGDGQLLLQQRSRLKYHSPGLWANSACGHPRSGEDSLEAATRRLREELGISTGLVHAFQARYREPVGEDMVENELVEVYFGKYPGRVDPDPGEVEAVRWISLDQLLVDVRQDPEQYAVWLRAYVETHFRSIEDAVHGFRRI